MTSKARTRDGEIHTLILSEIAKNPLNPRRSFDSDKIEEMTDSIRRHGVLQPILVRPHPKESTRTPYQLVIGECRWRAAKAAGLEHIRATLRTLTDEECLEIMLVENGQRSDLDPLEEADTYHRLHKEFGHSLVEVAAKVGKSKTAVFQRVKLMEAGPEVRKALGAGEIDVSVAELIARSVHPSQQKSAVEQVGPSRYRGALSYREAKLQIETEYMLRLAGVPWKLDDAKLDAEAGPCTTCPKRTGNQADLFSDTKAKDVCLDRECYDRKRAAHRAARLAAAAAGGAEVLDGKAAAAVFDAYGDLKASSGFVNLAESAPPQKVGARPRSIKYTLGKAHAVPVTIVAHPNSDEILEVARKEDVAKAYKAKGIKARPTPAAKSGKVTEETKRKHRTRFDGTVYDLVLEAIVRKIENREPRLTSAGWRALGVEILESVWHEASEVTQRRRGIEKAKDAHHKLDARHPLRAIIANASPAEILALILELLAQRHRPQAWNEGDGGRFLSALASQYSVDPKKIRNDARRYVAQIEKKRAAPKKKAPKRGKASRKKVPPNVARRTARKKATSKRRGGRKR